MNKTPVGTTPPAPGLEREEPDFWIEDDIPSDDDGGRSELSGSRQQRSSHKPERE